MKEDKTFLITNGLRVTAFALALLGALLSLSACQNNASVASNTSSSLSDSTSAQGNEEASSSSSEPQKKVSQDESKSSETLDEAAKKKYAAEIADFETRRAQIEQEFDNDPRQAGSASQMRQMMADHVSSLEALMTDLCAYVKALPGLNAKDVDDGQKAWEEALQEKLDEMNAEFEEQHYSGNAFGLNAGDEKRVRIDQRIDELLAMAYKAIGAEPSTKLDASAETQSKGSYVVRFNTGNGTFACDDIDIPESVAAYLEQYGEGSAVLKGPVWTAQIPNTQLKVFYSDGPAEYAIVTIEGPLSQIVSGLQEDQSIPLKDFVEGLSSYNGTFDLTQSMDRGAAVPCGNCYLLNGAEAIENPSFTGHVCVVFADSAVDPNKYFDAQGRALYFEVSNGVVGGKTKATLAVGPQ